jgi:hypothetical protein
LDWEKSLKRKEKIIEKKIIIIKFTYFAVKNIFVC